MSGGLNALQKIKPDDVKGNTQGQERMLMGAGGGGTNLDWDRWGSPLPGDVCAETWTLRGHVGGFG